MGRFIGLTIAAGVLALGLSIASEAQRVGTGERGPETAIAVRCVSTVGDAFEACGGGGGGGGGDGAILDGVTATIKATVRDYANSNPLGVAVTDATGDLVAVATSAAQTTGNTSLSSLDGKTTAVDTNNLRFASPTTSKYTEASVSFSASGDNTVVAGTGGQTVRVFKFFMACASSVAATFKDGAATSLTGAMTLTAITLDPNGDPWFVTSTGNAFVVNLGAGVQCSGRVYYTKS